MNEELRRLFWTRLAAGGFILLIILGNIWYAMRLTGQMAPPWLSASFLIITGVVFVAGVGMAVKYLQIRFGKPRELDEP